MAFKSNPSATSASANPAAHFKTLTKRQYPDVMPHQKDILEAYAKEYSDKDDVALQLPTGSGKTLVGLLIADWRRTKFNDRVVYLCPTKQLVRQTIFQASEKYGIDVVDLSGQKSKFNPADRTSYTTGKKVAISTYSGVFNTHPFFENPDCIIVDDAHAAENYIAKMWSLSIPAGTLLHTHLSEFLRPYITPQEHSRLTGDWTGSADTNWVEKLPSPLVRQLETELVSIIDAHANNDNPSLYFTWTLLRDHLDACHIYLGSRSILIRPLIPPTANHEPYISATQRIFMSATLGAGGDLERLTGRKSIDRLEAPQGFQGSGVGRRFFLFPDLALKGEVTDTLRLAMQKRAGRSVVLTPSSPQADRLSDQIGKRLPKFQVFGKDDIEADKNPFILSENAVAILASRYDGIDFPGDECRLLCIDSLPKAMNLQEQFIMSKMGAAALFNDRIQTRVLQATGRCTRALQDRSAVFVTGIELVDFLADDRRWQYFHPELQAELSFGVTQSTNVTAEEILENFEMFLENSSDWSAADGMIRSSIENFEQTPFPAMNELEEIAPHEITFQDALWNKDYGKALSSARTILASLTHKELRGYRALWHYLAGSAALRLSTSADDGQARAATEHYVEAKKAAPAVSWLNSLARTIEGAENTDSQTTNFEILKQVESLEQQFLKMGTVTNAKFEKQAAEIQKELSDAKTFESGQVKLGTLLGFSAGNDESDAAPDPWWLGEKLGIVFEDHANGKESTLFGATKARQASSHPKWIAENLPGADGIDVFPVLVTPCIKAKIGAAPHLADVRYWKILSFIKWATKAIGTLRDLKGTFPGEGDLLWRTEAAERLKKDRLTLETIRDDLPLAKGAMEIVS